MRPLRLVLAIASSLLAVLLLTYITAGRSSHVAGTASGTFHILFDWRSPSSLFPPSAIISLTDDNSTFFLARPANFGPLLPADGLSGQLWIGSGFGDDNLGRGVVASAEGELGCSDVPGWDEGDRGSPSTRKGDSGDKTSKTIPSHPKDPQHRTSSIKRRGTVDPRHKNIKLVEPSEQDGTDDHLHHPLPSSHDLKTRPASGKKSGHADIQSIQESAEIAGKVVLLSRGGCGFLEKVKWVQRRGGTALIVGDNVRGGALVTMYARGDTSNVTIPSLFTSHTTAHLLSSLVPSGSRRDDINIGDARRLGLALGGDGQTQSESVSRTSAGQSKDSDKNNAIKTKISGNAGSLSDSKKVSSHVTKPGLLGFFFSESPPSSSLDADDRRPPSSGSVEWLLKEGFKAGEESTSPSNKQTSTGSKGVRSTRTDASSRTKQMAGDGFVIGVHDWRDPDLVDDMVRSTEIDTRQNAAKQETEHSSTANVPKAVGKTPGSGEYRDHPSLSSKPGIPSQSGQSSPLDQQLKVTDSETQDERARRKSIAWSSSAKDESDKSEAGSETAKVSETHDSKPHEGLWVTLQPTTMSTSPFFDTLLVLVVSPLVTLTVVYALLLVRSRIRRRRWRAPKSVVERLPVRTYHTIASSSATTSSAQTSPPGTPRIPDQTTPLLHSSARPITQRPRSQTVGETPVASSSLVNRTAANASLDPIQEKRESGLTEWRRKYGGKQRECVVCLEEYVDGVSQVMSLPCGHEFHAECM
ncbi:hypothetical protein ANO11243_083690 [Dothideomycetidae sp. 11243]|nr:hypothetical protein ANO11243_083690 [fungal sp. No.11243]